MASHQDDPTRISGQVDLLALRRDSSLHGYPCQPNRSPKNSGGSQEQELSLPHYAQKPLVYADLTNSFTLRQIESTTAYRRWTGGNYKEQWQQEHRRQSSK